MRRLLLIPAAALAALLLACEDDDTPAPSATATPTEEVAMIPPTTLAEPDGLQFVLDSVGGHMDVDELRLHFSPALAGIQDDDVANAIFCFPSDVNAEVLDQEVSENGDTATLTVSWRVTGDAAAEIDDTIERTWEFERASDGETPSYQITSLPSECPFRSDDPSGTQEPEIDPPDES